MIYIRVFAYLFYRELYSVSMLHRPPRDVDPLTSDNTPSSDPQTIPPLAGNIIPKVAMHHGFDPNTVNHKMHKIWSVDSQENY